MILTITCIVATAILVAAEWKHWALVRVLAKFGASGSFVLLGLSTHGDYGRWVLIGLILGAIGDICLLGKTTRPFLAGLVAFLFGHLSYVVAIAHLVPPGSWLEGAGWLAIVPALAGVTTVALLWPRLGRLTGPVIAYLLAIVAMVIAAIAAWRLEALPAPARDYLALGAALFFVSDISVARNRFVGDAMANKAWGLPAYFAGQLLIAWSAIGYA